MVQRNALKAWNEGLDFKTLLLEDADIRERLSSDEIERIFNLDYHLKHVGAIFDRVFGSSA